MLSEQDILSVYEEANAIWFFNYKGDQQAPHALLTSGLHSDGYVNSTPVLCMPEVAEILARQLVEKFQSRNQTTGKIAWVIGSPYAAITFSYEVARLLGAKHGFCEKDPQDAKKMIWNRFVIPGGSLVLQCEELITTFGTTMEVRRAITEGNPEVVHFLPDVVTSVYRPVKLGGGGIIDVTALVARQVQSWEAESCPLCICGSEVLHPKKNWAKLTGKAA